MSERRRFIARAGGLAAVAAASPLVPGPNVIAQPKVKWRMSTAWIPALDILQGNAERMISLRHQEHMWEAANGETYVIINRGGQSGAGSLQLYSTPDHGLSWYPGPRFPGSDRNVFSDGYLDGKTLYVTYTTTAGNVVVTALKRQPTAVASWKTLWSSIAFSSPDTFAMNPAMAVDSTGVLWLLGSIAFAPHAAAPVWLVGLAGFLMLGPYSYLAGAISLDIGGKRGGATACGIIDGVGYLGAMLAGENVARLNIAYGWSGALKALAGVALLTTLAAAAFLVIQRRKIAR